MAKPPPPGPFVFTTTKKKTSTAPKSENSTFTAFINSHKALKPYAGQIRSWADTYGGITGTQLAAVIWAESRGNPAALLTAKVTVPQGSTNAAGVPFVPSQSGQSSIQRIAWQMSGAMVQSQGNVDQAFQSVDPTYTGAPISKTLPGGYVALPGATTTQTVTKSVDTSSLKKATTDPWVVEANGKLKLVYSTTPPANTVKYGGTPITQSEFTQVWKQTYSDTFQAYTGHPATATQIVQILKNAPSVYALSNTLASEPGFAKSPVYRQHAPGLQAIANQILGKGAKLPPGILSTAISQNWDQATFEQHLRTLPAYRQGPEFQTNLAQNTAAFQQIYGNPDPAVKADLANKTAAGWTPDELQSWLRSQPAYKSSSEYQAKLNSFMGPQGLGLITGEQATLSGAQVDQMLNAQNKLPGATPTKTPQAATPTSQPLPNLPVVGTPPQAVTGRG